LKTGLLHVLGGGYWQLPTVRLAKQLGYRVLVTDMHDDRPAYALADHHEAVNIADREATLRVAGRYNIDGVLCDTTDIGVSTAAYVAEALGLPGIGFETALNCTDKARMRTRTAAAGCDAPRFRVVHNEPELGAVTKLGFPLTVKPLDNQSGRGVTRVGSAEDLYGAYLQARQKSRHSPAVLAEEWIQGVEYIVDGFVVAGEPTVLGVARKTPNAHNPTVADHITYQSSFSDDTRERLAAANRRVLAALGLRHGVFHVEYKVRGTQVFPIDVAARGGGVMIYTHVLPQISGVDVSRKMIEFAMGEPLAIRPTLNRAANIEFLRLPVGTVQAIEGLDSALAAPGVIGAHLNIVPGSRIGRAMEKDQRPGYLIAVADSAEQAMQRTAGAIARLRISQTENL
jgi:biotin carboxylase